MPCNPPCRSSCASSSPSSTGEVARWRRPAGPLETLLGFAEKWGAFIHGDGMDNIGVLWCKLWGVQHENHQGKLEMHATNRASTVRHWVGGLNPANIRSYQCLSLFIILLKGTWNISILKTEPQTVVLRLSENLRAFFPTAPVGRKSQSLATLTLYNIYQLPIIHTYSLITRFYLPRKHRFDKWSRFPRNGSIQKVFSGEMASMPGPVGVQASLMISVSFSMLKHHPWWLTCSSQHLSWWELWKRHPGRHPGRSAGAPGLGSGHARHEGQVTAEGRSGGMWWSSIDSIDVGS